jgi:hypothetical protein
MNEPTEQTTPESLNTEIIADEEKIFTPQNELPFPESEVDLNEIFPEEESDLNDLFPDEETKLLLKKIQRNKKDLHTMTDRFVDNNWGGIDNDDRKPLDEGVETSSKEQNN